MKPRPYVRNTAYKLRRTELIITTKAACIVSENAVAQ